MKIREKLFEKRYNKELYYVPISDLPQQLLVNGNDITIYIEEANENLEYGLTTVEISTLREETQEEKEKRKKELEVHLYNRKEARRELFLKLKKEFENEQ